MKRLPQGEDWKDHAEPCPCCKEPVLETNEHWNPSGPGFDPGFWSCDFIPDKAEDKAECDPNCNDPHCPYTH